MQQCGIHEVNLRAIRTPRKKGQPLALDVRVMGHANSWSTWLGSQASAVRALRKSQGAETCWHASVAAGTLGANIRSRTFGIGKKGESCFRWTCQERCASAARSRSRRSRTASM